MRACTVTVKLRLQSFGSRHLDLDVSKGQLRGLCQALGAQRRAESRLQVRGVVGGNLLQPFQLRVHLQRLQRLRFNAALRSNASPTAKRTRRTVTSCTNGA